MPPGAKSRFSMRGTRVSNAWLVPVLLANVTQQVYQMARAAGFNKEDGSAVLKVLETLAGVTVGQKA